MPELAEVFFHAKAWKRGAGQAFGLEHVSANARCCRFFDVEQGRRLLKRSKLLNGYTHGKRMLFEFSGGVFVEVHLGMTGSLHCEAPDFVGGKHDHFVLRGDRMKLAFRDPRQFGKMALSVSDGLPAWWSELPPQPHDSKFDPGRFERICARRAGSVVKTLLLQQECFPGVGNWMADEILWRSGILPQRRVRSLSDEERKALYQAIRFVCRGALETVGDDYRDPPKSWLFSHRWKDGGNCPETGVPLKRESVGGRTTCWSPGRQF